MWTEGTIEVDDGVRLRWRRRHEGSRVVALPLDSAVSADLEELGRGRTLLAWDPRARGRSDAVDPEGITVTREVADLDALLASQCPVPPAVVAMGLYGAAAAVFSARHPRRLERLVLVSAPPFRRAERVAAATEVALRADADREERLARVESGGLQERFPVNVCRVGRRVRLESQFGDPAKFARMSADPCRWPNEWHGRAAATEAALLASLTGVDLRAEVARLTHPLLVVHGSDDPLPIEAARAWARAAPDGRLLEVPGAGAFVWAERPDVFFTAVESFLNGAWPAGAER
jgi:pimeloyl-ACP methyl ester carboxylesterase